jgi:hypothetical protein
MSPRGIGADLACPVEERGLGKRHAAVAAGSRGPSALRSARLPLTLIGSPINYVNRLIGSPITSQSTVESPARLRDTQPARADSAPHAAPRAAFC